MKTATGKDTQMLNKAPLLSLKELRTIFYKNLGGLDEVAQAQRDSDHNFYQDKIREIFEAMENGLSKAMKEKGSWLIFHKFTWGTYWQSLKTKYQEEQ